MWVAGARRPYVCDTHDEYCSFRYWLASVERERGEKIPVRQECFPKRPKVAC